MSKTVTVGNSRGIDTEHKESSVGIDESEIIKYNKKNKEKYKHYKLNANISKSYNVFKITNCKNNVYHFLGIGIWR